MLIEEGFVRQVPGENRRRWFRDEDFDVIVWYLENGSLYGFQLCYDKQSQEKALTWLSDRGFNHQNIDSGEQSPGKSYSCAWSKEQAI